MNKIKLNKITVKKNILQAYIVITNILQAYIVITNTSEPMTRTFNK
jgi:hypothetical protein